MSALCFVLEYFLDSEAHYTCYGECERQAGIVAPVLDRIYGLTRDFQEDGEIAL